GSWRRRGHRMKGEGAFDGAIPGVHCMLRRSFVLSMIFGAVAIALLIAFTGGGVVVAPPDVIGEIVYTVPGAGQRLEVTERARLQIREQPYDTGSYDAFIWLPTGVSNTYSSIEAAANTSFLFKDTRRMQLIGGSLRGLKIQPGGVGEGPFMVETPHCSVQVDEGSLSIYITPDGAETRVTVARGS